MDLQLYSNKEKYLIIKKGISEGRIIENNFLKEFLQTVGIRIGKGQKITEKQIEVLDSHIRKLTNQLTNDEINILDQLEKEAEELDIQHLLSLDRYELEVDRKLRNFSILYDTRCDIEKTVKEFRKNKRRR